MAVNKVDVNGSTVLDLTSDSVTPETLTKGATAHNAAGEQITGTYEAPVKSVNGKTGDVTLDYSDINAQQKLYNLTLDTPIVKNQTIDPNSTYTFSSPITLNEYETYWIDVQMVYEGKVQNRYQLLSRAVNGDSGITVQWMGYIVLDTTGVTLATSGDGSYIITIAKVLDYEIPVDSTIVYQEGSGCAASTTTAHAEGDMTTASGYGSHAEGNFTTASGDSSHAEGQTTTASGYCSHAEGINTTASGMPSHAEGQDTTASSDGSHSEGLRTTASGIGSHAEGYITTASGDYSHAEGCGSNTLPDTVTSDSTNDDIITAYNDIGGFSLAKGYVSHVEGADNLALGDISHAEGLRTTASGNNSHAEGWYVIASGTGSHAEGYGTKASSGFQHVQGKHNIEDSYANYAHIVGNGNDDSVRSNAHTLDWSGNAWFAGDVYVGSTSGTHKDAGSKKLATESTTVITTLSVSSWDSSTKTQTVSASGVTAASNGSLRIAQSATDEQFAAWGAAQPRVTAQAAGTLTVKAAGTVPTIDIPVEVLIV